MDKQEEFLRRLQATFKAEAEEHIKTISDGLLELEKKPGGKQRSEIIERVFRGAHSLKGAARSVNRRSVEQVCQALEDVFSMLKRDKIVLVPESFDLLHKIVDGIAELLSEPEDQINVNVKDSIHKMLGSLKTRSASKLAIPKVESQKKPVKEEQKHETEVSNATLEQDVQIKTSEISEMVRIPRAKLEPLFIQAEELIQTRAEQSQRILELKEISKIVQNWRVDYKRWKNDHLRHSDYFDKEWAIENERHISDIEYKVLALVRALENDARLTSRMVDNHVGDMKTLLMLPVSLFVESFPRLVRDLSRSKGKEIELIMEGTGIEVDKRVLDAMKDPLLHMIRNSVDHGIESSGERVHLNKTAKGKVSLIFNTLENNRLEVIVSDDGSGINLDLLEKSVLKAGLMSRQEFSKLNREEKLEFIYRSGISTSKMITDISGRGLGMSIVHENVMKMGGTINVESQPGKGTTIRLILPMSLSTFKGVMIKSEGRKFVLPIINVERTLRVKSEDLKTVENRETIVIDDNVVSFMRMVQVLKLPNVPVTKNSELNEKRDGFDYTNVVLLKYGDERIAFQVDEVISQQDVLVKELGKQIVHLRNISGACVLGSGEVVPILNVSDLIASATRMPMTSVPVEISEKKSVSDYNILVAEDSITSRTLLKNILESGGYHVVTAIDGSDAYTRAIEHNFDLVVSDVDMPRMNGFELITKIRNNKKMSEMPVVLVTSLDSRDDRERGIEVGANAYIVKSSFDQSNLLEVVDRLL